MKELNLAYLMLAQQLLREDRDTAMFRLGISDDDCRVAGEPDSGAGPARCRFRQHAVCAAFDLTTGCCSDLLSSHDRESGTARLHAMILAADKPVEAVA
ncbi:MAG: flagellar transcriptional regulator FlhD [Comamonadaceae bacterium]|nr:flagellar transcriptional regulator FlhD [Comamonadaceae bacterium]